MDILKEAEKALGWRPRGAKKEVLKEEYGVGDIATQCVYEGFGLASKQLEVVCIKNKCKNLRLIDSGPFTPKLTCAHPKVIWHVKIGGAQTCPKNGGR